MHALTKGVGLALCLGLVNAQSGTVTGTGTGGNTIVTTTGLYTNTTSSTPTTTYSNTTTAMITSMANLTSTLANLTSSTSATSIRNLTSILNATTTSSMYTNTSTSSILSTSAMNSSISTSTTLMSNTSTTLPITTTSMSTSMSSNSSTSSIASSTNSSSSTVSSTSTTTSPTATTTTQASSTVTASPTSSSSTTSTTSTLSTTSFTAPFASAAAALADFVFLGCYAVDVTVANGPLGIGISVESDDLTRGFCALFCDNYIFFGVTAGDDCYCGDDPPVNATTSTNSTSFAKPFAMADQVNAALANAYKRPREAEGHRGKHVPFKGLAAVDNDLCSTPCSGNASEACGGGSVNSFNFHDGRAAPYSVVRRADGTYMDLFSKIAVASTTVTSTSGIETVTISSTRTGTSVTVVPSSTTTFSAISTVKVTTTSGGAATNGISTATVHVTKTICSTSAAVKLASKVAPKKPSKSSVKSNVKKPSGKTPLPNTTAIEPAADKKAAAKPSASAKPSGPLAQYPRVEAAVNIVRDIVGA